PIDLLRPVVGRELVEAVEDRKAGEVAGKGSGRVETEQGEISAPAVAVSRREREPRGIETCRCRKGEEMARLLDAGNYLVPFERLPASVDLQAVGINPRLIERHEDAIKKIPVLRRREHRYSHALPLIIRGFPPARP